MLKELAVGDAYGAGFEYASPEFVKANNTLAGYVKHPKFNLKPGVYTDDTQMSIANAEVLLAGEPFTRESFAQAYVTAFKRDQREGYARGFYGFLCEVKDGSEFLLKMTGRSDKSGAAMRASVFGVLSDVEKVKEVSKLQAAITHNTNSGIAAAQAAALLSHYFLYDLGAKSEVGRFIEKHVPPGPWAPAYTQDVGDKGWMAVRAAITAVQESDSMSQLLKRCVDFTGDVDTVAAIALGAAAHSKEVTQDLPQVLQDNLENGTYGRDFLKQLDERLLSLVSK
jgi:ADP-ribosylglycohydrolase